MTKPIRENGSKAFWLALLLVFFSLATPACAASSPNGEPPAEDAEATEATDGENGEEGESMSEDELEEPLPELVAAAKSALAEKLEIGEEEITLAEAEKVLWRDSSLGCPEEGMMYAQALVDGARIVLEAGGHSYAYHSSLKGPPRYCESPAKNGAIPPEEGGPALQ